jgi:2-oxoglutarate ferredoxin oxidoreductase subunit alpha
MVTAESRDISVAIIGSGGVGAITVGELLLQLAGRSGWFGMMRGSFGPQIRGGEAAALLRISDQPVQCMNDSFDLMVSLDWKNAERFVEEISLHSDSLIIADPAAGKVPPAIGELGIAMLDVSMRELAAGVAGGRENMVALGLLACWLGLDGDTAGQLIEQTFSSKGEEITRGSRSAFEKGFAEPQITAARAARKQPTLIKPGHQDTRWQLSGNEACGLGALRGGVRFAAAYPITPASDVLEWLAPRLQKLGGSLVQAEDELASINMVIGASYGGIPSMTATSGPGLALMLEAIGLAVAAEIPALILNVMRGGPSTGIPTKSEQTDLSIALHGLHGEAPHLVLGALDHTDCILTTEWAVRLAEALQVPAMVLTDQNLAQSRVLMSSPDYCLPAIPSRRAPEPETGYRRYEDTESGISAMAIPGMASTMYVAESLEHAASGKPSTASTDHLTQLNKRARKINDFDFGDHWAAIQGTGTTAIITWGSTSAAVREAAERLRAAGQDIKVIAMRLLLPARPEALATALQGVERVLVVEQSHSRQFYLYLRAYYDIALETRVFARPGPLLIGPGEVVQQIENWS